MLFESTITQSNISFNTFKKFLRSFDYPTAGIGMANLIMGLNGRIQAGEIEEEEFNERLTEFVRDHLLFNNKVVYTILLSQAQMDNVLAAIQDRSSYEDYVDNSDNLDALSSAELRRVAMDHSYLKSQFTIEEAECFMFSARHAVDRRVTLDVSELRYNSENVDMVFGVKRIDYQSFDSIIIDPSTRTVDFCIDNKMGLSPKLHFKFFSELRSRFLIMFGFDFEDFRLTRNYFKLVRGYYDSEIGTVREIHFRTNTGSTKKEKMDENHTDLRQELFHSSGVAAVQRITPFSIEMMLKNPTTLNVMTHLLPGRAQTLSTAIPSIGFYEISGALNYNDYSFVKENIDELVLAAADV
jgi:hypothetical protein